MFLATWYQGLFALDAADLGRPVPAESPQAGQASQAGQGGKVAQATQAARDAPVAQVATDSLDRAFWDQVLAVRLAVAKPLEAARQAGLIGSGLDAELDLYAAPELAATLNRLGDELRFALITSAAPVHSLADRPADAQDTDLAGLAVRVRKSTHPKCVRCWHLRPDVGADPAHPELCGRCVDNVAGAGEERRFA